MDRRSGTALGAALAIAAGGALVGLSQRLYVERQRERADYRLELVRLRQEAARPSEGEKARPEPAPAATQTACAGGADALVLAAYRAAPAALLRDGRLETERLTAWSDQAVRAERWIEEAHEPPPLPRRIGVAEAPPAACFPVTVSKPVKKPAAPPRSSRGSRR